MLVLLETNRRERNWEVSNLCVFEEAGRHQQTQKLQQEVYMDLQAPFGPEASPRGNGYILVAENLLINKSGGNNPAT